jgi:hypothetical protein
MNLKKKENSIDFFFIAVPFLALSSLLSLDIFCLYLNEF